MKIEIPQSLPDDLAAKIGIAARELIQKEIEALQEAQLLNELRESPRSDVDKVRLYIERTRQVADEGSGQAHVRVTNEHVYKGLGITPARMKVVRDALEREGFITARFAGGGAIEIHHWRAA